jgi:hypothetical protein
MRDHSDIEGPEGSDLIPRRELERSFRGALSGTHADARALLRVVELVLSTYVAEGRAQDGNDIYVLSRTVAACGRTDIIRNRRTMPAPFQALREMPWPHGLSGLRALGLTRPQLGQVFARAQHQQGSMAVLDREILATLVPLELWPVLATMVLEGPGIVVERLERYMLELSMRPVRPSRSREPGATHSDRSLSSFATALRRVMGILSDLQRRDMTHPALAQWGAPPRVKVPRTAVPANTDRSSPALHQLRHALRSLDNEFKERLKVGRDDDELAAIEAARPRPLMECGAWRLGRNRALFALLCTIGSRIGSTLRLMVSDFEPEHKDPDGRIGPAIALRPGKVISGDEIRWKPLPPCLARMLAAHILLTRRLALETDAPDKRKRSRRDKLPEDYPLFPASIKQLEQPWDRASLYGALAGHVAHGPARGRPWYPVAHRNMSAHTASRAVRKATLGYSPHTLRGATKQMVRTGGIEYCAEHNIPIKPEVIADGLLDHDIHADPYGYADLSTPAGRERLSRIGALIAWEMLTTDRGARKCGDTAGLERAVRKRDILRAEFDRMNGKIGAAVAEARSAKSVPTDLLLDLLANDERDTISARLTEAEADVQFRLHDTRARIPMPDDMSDEALREEVEAFDKARRRLPATDRPAKTRLPDAVRDWILIREHAYVFGVVYATSARWAVNEHIRYSAGHPRHPWKDTVAPVDTSLGERRRRIWVGGINPALIHGPAQERLAQILAAFPTGWPEDRARAPLVLPEPYSSQYGATRA